MTEKLHEQFSLNRFQIGITLPVLLLGILAFSFGSLFAWLTTGLWLVLVTSRNGVEIDYQARQINFFIRLIGFIKLDSWEKVSKYRGYIIRRKVSSVRYSSRVQEQTFHIDQTILGLYKHDPKNFKTVKVDHKPQLIMLGLQLEEKLGLKRHITKK